MRMRIVLKTVNNNSKVQGNLFILKTILEQVC